MTQIEQIKAATRAYIHQLNDPTDGMSWVRYAIYLDSGNGLQVLWPKDCHLGAKSKELLPSQVHSNIGPAFHFKLGGCGYSKTHELGQILRKINKDINVFEIDGFSPSQVSL